MTLSRLSRIVVWLGAVAWIVAPSLQAQGWQPAQIESPLPTPLFSPPPTPQVDPACTAFTPCTDGEPTPESGFQSFLPGVTQGSETEEEPAGQPPDLGTLLNYAAVAVVIIGGALKIYWFISDRRKPST